MNELSDDVEIFSLLEQAGQAGFDPSENAVTDFVFENRYWLLIFIPNGKYKGCRLFSIAAEGNSEQKWLLEKLMQLPEDDVFGKLKNEALLRFEYRIASDRGAHLYFDAH